jgi:hypothetical protein
MQNIVQSPIDPATVVSQPAPGRECGTCTLCCKVYDVPSLAKPMGKWCQHCTPGRGCGIWATRPEHCRAFHCLWITESWLGDHWKPEKAKFVLTLDPTTKFMMVQVDPGAPQTWKAEPYYSQLKRWAGEQLQRERLVVVWVNQHATVLTPTQDVVVGVMQPGDRLGMDYKMTPTGPAYNLSRIPAGA